MAQLDAASLAAIEKSNHFDIHQSHSLQVQHDLRRGIFYLPFQFVEMLEAQSTNEANDGLSPSRLPFDFQCHSRFADVAK
jgi:uncharacterized protein (DUF924 family)